MKPLTPKQIVRKYHGAPGINPLLLTLDIDEIVFLIKAYHKQFEVKKTETIPYQR